MLSNRMLHSASAQTLSLGQDDSSLRQTPFVPASKAHALPPATDQSKLMPPWAHGHPSAGLNQNLHHDKFAQYLNMDHVPPPVYFPTGDRGEIISDDGDEEDEAAADIYTSLSSHGPSGPHSLSLPLDSTMSGYSEAADAFSSPASVDSTHPIRKTFSSNFAAESATYSIQNETEALFARVRDIQGDWLQGPVAQVVGALAFFLFFAMIIESVRYMWQVWRWRRAGSTRDGRMALEGDEKQLRAFPNAAERKFEASVTSPDSLV